MKFSKWIKIGLASLVSIGVVTACSVTLFWNVDAPTPINTYCLQFSRDKALTPDEQKNIDNKNAFINKIVNEANKVITDYKHDNKKDLIINFANLTSNQTQGEINYYTSLDRTLKEISTSLGIVNQQRTPKLINEAFYNKNTEMMTFYWSPDYNSIGTWLKYMFTDTYTMANMWPPTYSLIKKYQSLKQQYSGNQKTIKEEMDSLLKNYPWVESLATFISQFNIPGTTEPLFKSPIEILNFVASNKNSTKIQIDDYYVNIANVIGRWVSDNSSLDITKDVIHDPITNKDKDIYNYQSDLPVGIQFVNWIASQNPNIPYQEVGSGAESPFLCSNGLYMPPNSNTDTSFRDWYYYENEFTNSIAKDWWNPNPFQSNETAWNPAFSKAPNSLFAQSIWTGLTSWTTIGDENDKNFPEENTTLVANGIMNDITDPNVFNSLEQEFKNEKTLTFQIRPIPWVNSKGQPTGKYLSPADFYAGFYAFKKSIDNGINANNAYFIGLAAIDFEKTLNDKNNIAKNNSVNDHKNFKVYFKDPILNLRDTLDIFQKQYFDAIPYDHPEVQNIIDPNKYNKIAVNFPNTQNLNIAATDMNKFYGVGIGYDSSVWSDLWSAGPYYISSVNQQSITYNLNEEYFKMFNDVKDKKAYKSFSLSRNINNKKANKIKTVNIKYAGSYNLDILYEQFKAGELNKSLLQSVNLMDALSNQKQYLRYQNVKKINKSNVIGFNLQIYEKWNEPADHVPAGCNPAQNIIMDQDGNPMWDQKTRKVLYSIDEYGNYVWPKGKQPKRKSNVSKVYEDLIVRDFYTPFSKKSKSKTIRFAIMNSINWVSLKSLVTPGVSASIQYSFMPYGVYELYNKDRSIKSNYWDLAANKRYLTKEQLTKFDKDSINLRMSGNMIWTYDELVKATIKTEN